MNAIKTVHWCAALLAFAACVHSRSIFDGDTDDGPLVERSQIDLAQLTPDQRAALVAQQARDSALLETSGFLRRESAVPDAYFIRPEDITQMNPRTVSDIFRHVPGLAETLTSGTTLAKGQGCFITFVNGLLRQSRVLSDLDANLRARDVFALEVYPPGPLPPAPFNRASSRADCTTVALWTRSIID
ncbi:MAG TPA: hypothetical protein VJV97_10910 [Gemmatimonadaceae bacterium]|nr:hypothetical protein [Gemmatimonadaceae bacterium]